MLKASDVSNQTEFVLSLGLAYYQHLSTIPLDNIAAWSNTQIFDAKQMGRGYCNCSGIVDDGLRDSLKTWTMVSIDLLDSLDLWDRYLSTEHLSLSKGTPGVKWVLENLWLFGWFQTQTTRNFHYHFAMWNNSDQSPTVIPQPGHQFG